MWRSLVARLNGVQEAAGSIPVTQTILTLNAWVWCYFLGGFCILKNFLSSKLVAIFFLIGCGFVGFCSAESSAYHQFKKVSETLSDSYRGETDSKNSFFSMLSRMRYVKRWSLLKNSEDENLESHSFEVAVIAHALATIKNEKFGGQVDADRAAVLGLFHDCLEIITGDAPTPVKYFDPEMKEMYTKLEEKASEEMLEKIEDTDIRERYSEIISPNSASETLSEEDKEMKSIVKAADDISALIKCLRERHNGNNDFEKAYERLYDKIKNNDSEEVKYFIDNYFPSYCC